MNFIRSENNLVLKREVSVVQTEPQKFNNVLYWQYWQVVSGKGSLTYRVAKVLTKVLKPLIGKSLIVYKVQGTLLIGSRGTSPTRRVSLFIWCLHIVHLSSNRSSPQHYQRSIGKGWNLVGQVSIVSTEHHWTSFLNKFYEQVEGTAMGSWVSSIVANLYMEHLEREALWSVSTLQVLA